MFVCTGNTCRSPMAEKCFAAMTAVYGIKTVSAGLYAFDGEAMSENSLTVLAEIGIDGSAFRSQSVSCDLVNDSSLILAMTAGHQRELLVRYPQAADKCRLLLEKSGGGDVHDPFGHGLPVYRHTLFQIKQGLTDWIKYLNISI